MFAINTDPNRKSDVHAKLRDLLASDLGFHSEDSSELSHDFHAFPAKFPPQLPRLFIECLTLPGQRVLDPMMGSGTCIVEASALGREAIGFDIDPLAVLLSKVKHRALEAESVRRKGLEVLDIAEFHVRSDQGTLRQEVELRFDAETRKFLDYWFSNQTQLELVAIIREIEKVNITEIRDFLLLVFSSIIITKSGGVSLAWDLAHTRPHKLKQGISKSYKPAIKEFRRKLLKNIDSLRNISAKSENAVVSLGNAQALPLRENCVDLIVTSPPYASNAIDYMRAHKFSLVWLGHRLYQLSDLRSKYIGGENVSGFQFSELPSETRKIIQQVTEADEKKGLALRRYYSEMHNVLSEAFRVLKPGKAGIFVVGSSSVRGISSQTHDCIGEIGTSLGFELGGIGIRKLDRDRRMLPASAKTNGGSQIELRMHEEYIVALVKPTRELRSNGNNS
jgi:DNA modification methylase